VHLHTLHRCQWEQA